MKTYEEYEKEYEELVLGSAGSTDYVARKELWIGFKLCTDENKEPALTDDFLQWIDTLDERLVDCVGATIELVNKLK